MEFKYCVSCKKEKPIREFYLKKNGRYHSWCDTCRKENKKKWNADKVDHIKEYRIKTKEHRDIKGKEYREKNREKILIQSAKDNERLKEKRKKDRESPIYKAKKKAYGKQWRKENRERYNKYFHDYYEKDESKKIGRNLRNRLRKVLKGISSAIHAHNIAGCSLEFLKSHLESQFVEGMSWDNYPIWHVDHHLPCNAFNFNDPVHQRACFYWKNLKPLWGSKNMSKNDNYDPIEFDNYINWFINNVENANSK